MQQINEPPSIYKFDYGAWQISVEDITRITEMLRRILNKGDAVTYRLVFRDKSYLETASIEDLDSWPFHEKHKLKEFAISGWHVPNRIGVDFEYSRFAAGMATVSASNLPNIASNVQLVHSYLRGMRVWYSPIVRFFQPPGLSLVGFLSAALIISPLHWGDVVGMSAIATWAACFLMRYVLFDPIAVYMGRERNRQEDKEKARKWVFGTLLGTLVLGGLIGGILSGLAGRVWRG